MTEAMQITVSSEMANRIEDSSSTPARRAWEPDFMRRPWVLSDMGGSGVCEARKKKGGTIAAMDPPFLGLLLAVGSVPPGQSGRAMTNIKQSINQRRPAM